jgi:hypothetical protein
MEADSDRQDQNARQILQTVTISGSATPNLLDNESQLFKNLNMKTSLK